MSDDLLARMTQALADENDGATAFPEATRARVIRTLAERKPRRKKWFVVGVPAFVIFGGSSAWASMTGHLPPVVEQAISAVTFGAVDFAKVDKPKIRTRVFERKLAEPLEPQDERSQLDSSKDKESTRATEESAKEPLLQLPEESPARSASHSVGAAPSIKHVPVLDPALATYQSAHRAQFRAGDCSAAVDGYAEYLKAAPGGSFAVDARYNRAVCLLKLGQTSEAKAILRPFSEGRYGTYRQKSASELLGAFE